MMNRFMAWYFAPRSKQFYRTLIFLGVILGIAARWYHQDFLSGFGFGLVIATFFMYAIDFRKREENPE